MRKILGILLVLALVLSFSLVATTPVAAVTPVPPGTGTIQAAVLASSPNDILQLTPGGIYIEPQITILHNLTIMGGSPKPVINPTANLQGNNAAGAWFLVNSGVSFSLSNVVLDGSTFWVHQAIRNHGFTTIDQVDFLNIQGSLSGSPYLGFAVCSYGGTVPGGAGSDTHSGGAAASTLVVTDSTFAQIGRIGVLVKGTQSTATVSGCTYTGRGSGDWLDYGVEVGAGGTGTITDNVFTNCGTSTTAWASAGVLVTDFYGLGSAATITYNTFTNSQRGVAAGYGAADQSVIAVHFNSFSGNTFGIRNSSTAVTVDATLNWWGDASGPYHTTGNPGGTGDPVSDNVNFTPWYFVADPDIPVTSYDDIGDTATGTGPASFGASAGTIVNLTAVDEATLPLAGKPRLAFPHGFFALDITGLTNGQTVTVSIMLPQPVPTGTQYWKYYLGAWHQIPMTIDPNDSRIIHITLVDGGLGDGDGLANGTIEDQGGPGTPRQTVGWEGSSVNKAAVVAPWIALLAAMMAGALLVVRRRRAQI